MKKIFFFLAGLVMSLVFAGFAIAALGMTVMLVVDFVDAGGDLDTFEARIRHYTDNFVVGGDAMSFRYERASHPFLQTFGMLIVAWLGTVGSAMVIDALGTRIRSLR